MASKNRYVLRERVFVMSLMLHGFRRINGRRNLKKRCGYVIPATRHDDHNGIDAWVKMPGDISIIPIQITQRGVRLHKKYHGHGEMQSFLQKSEQRIRYKRTQCRTCRIAFVLVRDHDGHTTNRTLAWGDVKALRYAIQVLTRGR